MLKEKIKASLVIVNYKSRRDTLECISNLGLGDNFEIIVVDNSSDKYLRNELSTISGNIKYIDSGSNLGYGAGNNLGIKCAKSEYILILNPDTRPSLRNIFSLVDFIKRKKEAGIVAPELVNHEGNIIKQIDFFKLTPLYYIFRYTFISKLFSKSNFFENKDNIFNYKKDFYEVDVVPGSIFLIRKSLFEEIGGFDEKFFLYFEDNDLCNRVKSHGYKIFKLSSVKILHDWKPAHGNKVTKKYFEQSRFYYFRKYYGLLSAVIVELFSRKWWSLKK